MVAIAACVFAAQPALAARIVVAAPPGSTADLVARAIAGPLGEAMGQPVAIDNRPGPIDAAAAESVARAQPDGSTMLLATPAFVALTTLSTSLPFDGMKAFAPVARIATEPLVVVATSTFPTSTVQDLIAVAKANPGRLSYASGGAGSVSHLAAELLKSVSTVQIAHLPAKSTDAALADVIAGRAKILIAGYSTVEPSIRGGKLKALAIAGPSALPLLPDVPTMREVGILDYDFTNWFGVLVPAATSKANVERLNADLRKALQSEEVRAKLRALLGADARVSTPEEMSALLSHDLAIVQKLAREVNLRLE
jgi:tripartite-type tricarboxylate transporter receptor subunit TctC